ncbi:hypothetical protein BCC0238_007061 (plasmid) [Burkholderia gladioli]
MSEKSVPKRQYTDEFKNEAVRLAESVGQTATSTASPGYAGFWAFRAADIASGAFVPPARGPTRTRSWMRKWQPSTASTVARMAARVSCGNCELKVARRARSVCGVACSARACVRSTGVPGGSRRTRRTAFPSRRTCWIVVSTAGSLIAPGSAISRLSGPAKAGCISRRFSIWRAGASWAGQCPNASTPSWFVRHCTARAGNANRHRDCYYTRTEGRNIQAGPTESWPPDSGQRSP